MRVGFSGRIAHAFIDSKLTPLVIAASLGLGALALVSTPREEEPQIRVPMVDVRVAWPGSEPAEVAKRVVEPIERAMWSLSQVEHVQVGRSHRLTEPARERYLNFLRAGGSVDPIEGLRQAGVDMSTPEPIERAFAIMDGYIDRLEALVP